MKNIAICYSEHAIKVSDSYCSGTSNRACSSSHLTPSIQSAVTCIYKVKPSTRKQLLIRLTWCNRLNQGFCVGLSDYPFSITKFSKSSRVLRRETGSFNFESGGLRVDLFWDLSRARYESGPEPITGFYVVVLVDSEVCLVLGDMEEELKVKKCICDVKVAEFSLISRSEEFCGNRVCSTRAKFSERGNCHDILIKCCVEDQKGVKDPVLSVYIDKKSVIEVKRLQWNFRGNQSVFLDGLWVDLMWDVHDWLFSPPSSSSLGNAVFLFRTRKGLDSRLWLEEKNLEYNEEENAGFSFLICACKNPD